MKGGVLNVVTDTKKNWTNLCSSSCRLHRYVSTAGTLQVDEYEMDGWIISEMNFVFCETHVCSASAT